jgi:hypothetical protein
MSGKKTTKKIQEKAQTKNAKTKTPKVEAPIETTPKELTPEQIAQYNEIAVEVFNATSHMDLNEKQLAVFNKIVSKLKVPKPKKEKVPKAPKRTIGRLIAPTLRVKDENAILESLYAMKSMLSGQHFKGGWGEIHYKTPNPKLEEYLKPVIEDVQTLIHERHIADDTVATSE